MPTAQANPAPMEQTFRVLQIVHGCLLLFVLVYMYVMHLIPVQSSAPFDSKLVVGCAIVALIDLAIATTLRSRKLGPALQTLQTAPDDDHALALWRQGSILSGVQAMTVVLFGMALHFVGAPNWQVAAFFTVGTALMLLWWPKRP